MSSLDTEWAIAEIDRFLHLSERVSHSRPGLIDLAGSPRGSNTENQAAAHVVEQILDRVLPQWHRSPAPDLTPGSIYKWDHLRDFAARARAELVRREEIQEKLGDNAPSLDAGQFHPWVWAAAATFWRNGHYRTAVGQAAVMVNAETQKKVQRPDMSETKLFQNVFSLDAPKQGQPRLRLMTDDGSDTYKSVHRGAAALAEGLYASFRNPSAHTVQAELPEQEALEQLAAFSALARLVDRAKLETI